MVDRLIGLMIEGKSLAVPPSTTIIQACALSGEPLVDHVGCMGQGVCGSCRCMVRRAGAREVSCELACETLVEEGMQISFVAYLTPRRTHTYQIEAMDDSWGIASQLNDTFPEARHCRHCNGCDRSCPKGIEVQRGVNLAAAGDLRAASDVFENCVMCSLCTLACPEYIRPNHLGMFARRAVAALSMRPNDLISRLRQIETGEMQVDVNALDSRPAQP